MNGKAKTEFTTNEVSHLARVSLRQLQWWDETRLIRPDGKRRASYRRYTHDDVFRTLLVAELRQRRLSLQRVRNILKALSRSDRREDIESAPVLLVDATGLKHALIQSREEVVPRCARWSGAVFLIDLDELRERLE